MSKGYILTPSGPMPVKQLYTLTGGKAYPVDKAYTLTGGTDRLWYQRGTPLGSLAVGSRFGSAHFGGGNRMGARACAACGHA